MSQLNRPRPATVEDFDRLADLAEAHGIEIFQDAEGRWFATSDRTPFVHTLTGFSCDCIGFTTHGRCTHHALFLRVLKWAPCRYCRGVGTVFSAYWMERRPCDACQGTWPPERPDDGAPALLPLAA